MTYKTPFVSMAVASFLLIFRQELPVLVKIIVGICIGIFTRVAWNINNLLRGVMLFCSLVFIGTSAAYSVGFGILAIIEIVVGYALANLFGRHSPNRVEPATPAWLDGFTKFAEDAVKATEKLEQEAQTFVDKKRIERCKQQLKMNEELKQLKEKSK